MATTAPITTPTTTTIIINIIVIIISIVSHFREKYMYICRRDGMQYIAARCYLSDDSHYTGDLLHMTTFSRHAFASPKHDTEERAIYKYINCSSEAYGA